MLVSPLNTTFSSVESTRDSRSHTDIRLYIDNNATSECYQELDDGNEEIPENGTIFHL